MPAEPATERVGIVPADPATDRFPVVGADPGDADAADVHPVRRAMGWAAGTALVLVVALAVAVAIVPALGGGTALTVLSGSMEPGLPVGSTVVVRATSPDGIAVGDVITFTDRTTESDETRVVTHRVIAVEPGPAFRTQGDANAAPDPGLVAAADVRGALWYHVPYVGLLRERLLTPPGAYFAVAVALLAVAAHLLVPRHRTRTGHAESRARPAL